MLAYVVMLNYSALNKVTKEQCLLQLHRLCVLYSKMISVSLQF